jgi:hypothetical protein
MADARKILNDTQAYFAAPLRPRTVTHSLLTILRVFVVVDAIGVGLACVQIVRSFL